MLNTPYFYFLTIIQICATTIIDMGFTRYKCKYMKEFIYLIILFKNK